MWKYGRTKFQKSPPQKKNQKNSHLPQKIKLFYLSFYWDDTLSLSTDEIFRRKLLIEGDGGQDDKRISNLIRLYIRWFNTDVDSEER